MRRIKRLASITAGITAAVILSVIAVLFGNRFAQAQGAAHVDVVAVKGVIDPFVAQYLARGIQLAEQDGAQCLVIQLDTPGGSDNAMRDIVQHMLSSPVPIVVYVSPAGARAARPGSLSPLPRILRRWLPAPTSALPIPWRSPVR